MQALVTICIFALSHFQEPNFQELGWALNSVVVKLFGRKSKTESRLIRVSDSFYIYARFTSKYKCSWTFELNHSLHWSSTRISESKKAVSQFRGPNHGKINQAPTGDWSNMCHCLISSLKTHFLGCNCKVLQVILGGIWRITEKW